MRFNKNDKIGAYTVTFPHKQGTCAETYRVKDASGHTRFLKLIPYSKLRRNQLDDQGRVMEVEISRQLDHPNLCHMVDDGMLMLNGGQYAYLVTEFVSGETLSQHLTREEKLSVYEIKEISKAVLSALDYLHNRPVSIVHGGVNLQNILLSLVGELGDLKLIDFSHASLLNQKPAKPDLRQVNPFSLAPECFAGVNQVQSDLYAVGAMMYRLIYEEWPWFVDLSRVAEADRVDFLLAEREKPLAMPKLDLFEFDEQLANTIAKALNYDVEERFQTADDFIQAICGEVKIAPPECRRKVQSDGSDPSESKRKSPRRCIKGEGFAAVAGMEELKTQLREEVIEPLTHPEEYARYGVTIPNGMLLYGPPGCGKTFFAKHFAEEAGFHFQCITPATLKSRFVNATQENIAQMFKEAEENAPTMIFIDEINELVPNRQSDVHEMSKSAVNEMLAQMDRTGERGIFIIGATNYPQMIDPAILRAGRMEKKYYVGLPDLTARKALFQLYLQNRPYDFGLDYDKLAELTHHFVSADIQLIVNKSALAALKSRSKITMDHLCKAIAAVKPSLDEKEIQRYEAMKTQIERRGEDKPKSKPHIGFR